MFLGVPRPNNIQGFTQSRGEGLGFPAQYCFYGYLIAVVVITGKFVCPWILSWGGPALDGKKGTGR